MWIAIKRTTVGTFSVHGSSGKLAACLGSMRYIWSRERVCNVRHFPCYAPSRGGSLINQIRLRFSGIVFRFRVEEMACSNSVRYISVGASSDGRF